MVQFGFDIHVSSPRVNMYECLTLVLLPGTGAWK
jgi:hypothetical protein